MADNTTGAPPTNLPTNDGGGTAQPQQPAPQEAKDPKNFDDAASKNLNTSAAPQIPKNEGAPYGGGGAPETPAAAPAQPAASAPQAPTTDGPAPAPAAPGKVQKDYNAKDELNKAQNAPIIPGTDEEEILKELSKGGGGSKKIIFIIVGVLVFVLVLLLIVLLVVNRDDSPDGTIEQPVVTPPVVSQPVVPQGPTMEERDLQRVTDIRRIQEAIRRFWADNKREPRSLSELVPLYLDSFPIGPQQESYFYSYSEDGQHYHVAAILEDNFHSALLTDDDFDSRLLNIGGFDGADPKFDASQ